MKISKITLVLFLAIVLCISSISEINSLSAEKKKKKKKIKPHENTFGKMVKSKTFIKGAPWTVKRCDQIVVVKNHNFIPDHEDFTKRTKIVITMTAYYINLFSKKNPDKLVHSILFSESKRLPIMQRGARGCVRVNGGKHMHTIIICGNNEKEGRSLLAAINFFSICRGGQKAPAKATKEKFKNVLRACGLNSGFKNPKALKRKIKQMKRKNKKGGNNLKRASGFFHPGFSGVPGTKKNKKGGNNLKR